MEAHHFFEGSFEDVIVTPSAAKQLDCVLVGFCFTKSSPAPVAREDLGAGDAQWWFIHGS
jgi:hypothetical protein